MAEEQVFYSDENGIRVTGSRFIVGSTTYPMAGITSVRTMKIVAKRSPAIWTIIIGIAMAFFGFQSSATIGTLGILVLGIGLLILFLTKDTYVLRTSTAAGETDALSSKGDSEYIDKVARALNEAVIHRG